MIDADLSELVKKFYAVQKQEVLNQIGERNVVEIINVLRKKKLVDLIYTLDGKEYLTWDQLRREVFDEVVLNGGRMNVVDLPGSLNVHVTHIERVLPEILRDPTIQVESGELMTDEYLDSTIQSAAEMLKEQGSLAIVDFAKTHQFSSVFAQKLLTRAVESRRLDAVVEENAIYTTQFVGSQRVILRAGLMAATRPVNLTTFFERHNLFLPLMDRVVECVRGELPGKVDGRIYVPNYFEVMRTEQVDNIYFSNGFIEYAALQTQGISQPKEFLLERYNPAPAAQRLLATPGAKTRTGKDTQQRGRSRRHQPANAVAEATEVAAAVMAPVARTESHPNAGHALSKCFVSDRFLANLVVFEDLADGNTAALDLALHLPSAVNFERDFSALIGRLRDLHPIINSCIVLDGGILVHNSVLDRVERRLRTAFEENLKQRRSKEKRKTFERPVFDEEGEQLLLQVVSEVTGLSLEEYGDALNELCSQCNEMAETLFGELAAVTEQNASTDLKRMRLKLQASLGTAWVEMFIAARGVAWLVPHVDEATATAVNRHVLATRAVPMVRDILLNESLDTVELHERVNNTLAAEQLSVAVLQKGLRAFQKRQLESLLPLVEATNGKSVDGFVSILQEMCSSGEIAISSFHQPNKKVERETLAVLKKQLVDRIESDAFTTDVAHSGALFVSVCSLLVHKHFHVHLELPGRAASAVVARLAKEALDPALEDLQGCCKCIIDAISRNELCAESVERLEQLRKTSLEGV